MKSYKLLIPIFILLIGLSIFFLQAEEKTEKLGNFGWTIIDDFESCLRWPIINKRYFNYAWAKRNPVLSIQKGASRNMTAPSTSPKKDYCLGAKIKVDATGEVRKFIFPNYNLDIDGVVKRLSFWVHSRNEQLTIKVILKDHYNTLYTLEPSEFTLNFYGWKQLFVEDIDKKIRNQLRTTDGDYKPMQFIGFIVTNPLRKRYSRPVYLYIDQLQAYTRLDEFTDYDGADMPSRW